jgi:low affinity Fe/Cu permease
MPETMSPTSASMLERFSAVTIRWAGHSTALVLSLIVVSVWAVTGPVYHYSDAWQLVINSITNIVTFVMVFVIQHGQNKDSLETQLKLNELIAAARGASNRLLAVDQLSEDELRVLHERYVALARQKQDGEPTSITEAPLTNR